MKFTPEVIAAFNVLKNAAENDFDKSTVADFETTLKEFSNEIWRDIAGYEGLYQASNCGRIRKINSATKGILKGHYKQGYMHNALSKNGRQKKFFTHRLIAETFIPNPENKPVVNHIDGNKLNNRVENLEWATVSENTKHAYAMGLEKVLRGADNGNAKFTSEQIAEIRSTCIKKDKNVGIKELAKKYHVNAHTISRIVNCETYKNSV